MTTREQRIESVGESYEPGPAPRYSDRELSRQLIVATRALGALRIERDKLEKRVVKLEAALAMWEKTYPPKTGQMDPHRDDHERGYFSSNCPGCVAEFNLLALAEKVAA